MKQERTHSPQFQEIEYQPSCRYTFNFLACRKKCLELDVILNSNGAKISVYFEFHFLVFFLGTTWTLRDLRLSRKGLQIFIVFKHYHTLQSVRNWRMFLRNTLPPYSAIVFCQITHSRVVEMYCYTKYGGGKFLRNPVKYLPNYTASHLRRLQSSQPLTWETQLPHVKVILLLCNFPFEPEVVKLCTEQSLRYTATLYSCSTLNRGILDLGPFEMLWKQ